MFYQLLSLFSGCGGLDLGFEQAGFQILAANEKNKKIGPTYRYNHPKTRLIESDIHELAKTNLAPEITGEVDGIIGGPPCQSWSEAGAKKGILDPRGQLFFEYIRLLREFQPKFFLAENVRGMLAPRHKKVVSEILKMFEEAGYEVNFYLVNAKDYGVAQERKRIFYIGFRKDLGISFSFPEGSTKEANLTLRDIIWDLQSTAVPANPKNRHNPETSNQNEYYVGSYSPVFMSRNRVKSWEEPAFTIQASGRQCQIHPSFPKMIKTGKDHYEFQKGYDYRRLTVRECARIQGFPDSFLFFYEKVDLGYEMIGNAVPVPLAYEIALAIKKSLDDSLS